MRKDKKNTSKQTSPQIIIIGTALIILSLSTVLVRSIRGTLYSSIVSINTMNRRVLTGEKTPLHGSATMLTGEAGTRGIFTDVPYGNNFTQKLQFLKTQGIMKGYSDGSFKPQNPMNRAEFIKTLVQAKEGNSTLTQNNCFKDVHGEWFAPYVCEAKNRGWVSGYNNNTFHPAQNINRAEALKILVNVYDLPTTTRAPNSNVSDFSKNQWYTTYVWTADQNGMTTDWSINNRPGGLSPKDMGTPISRLDAATAIYHLETTTTLTDYPQPQDMTCGYEAFKGQDAAAAANKFPPKDKYDIERKDMVMFNQDDFGPKTCFPTSAGMSFTWLKAEGYKGLVNDLKSGSPDYSGMIEELQKDMDWNENDGTNSAQAVTGIAKYLKDHGASDNFTIEFITKAPKNGKFPLHDALEGKTSVNGVGFTMARRDIKGNDVVDQMKKGQDVIIGIRTHVIEIAGIDEKPNANGNYDVKLADPALGTTVGAEITPDGKLKVGDKKTTIMDLLAVSPKKDTTKK